MVRCKKRAPQRCFVALLYSFPASPRGQGTLVGLDTSSPVLYIEFPSGRLKIPGTLCFPGAKHVVLKVGTKNAICEDVLDSIVAFGRPYWVGTKEENPTEAELPLPSSIVIADASRGDARELRTFPPPRAPKPKGTPVKGDKKADLVENEDKEVEKVDEKDASTPPSPGASAGEKRKQLDDEEGEEPEEDEEVSRARPRAKTGTA